MTSAQGVPYVVSPTVTGPLAQLGEAGSLAPATPVVTGRQRSRQVAAARPPRSDRILVLLPALCGFDAVTVAALR
jgi:hypothetical protein